MTLFTDRDERILENLRILNSPFLRKKYPTVRGERPSPFALGGSAPTLVIAAANSSDSTKKRADFICTGVDDHLVFQLAIQTLLALNGGRLLVCEGDYYFSGTVFLTGSIRIEGMGKESTRIHMAAAANVSMFSVDHTVPAPIGPIEFASLDMDGAKATQTAGVAYGLFVEPNGSSSILLSDVSIRDFRNSGANFDRCARTVYIDRCSFNANTDSGLNMAVEGYFFVTNCTILGNGQIGVKADGARLKMMGCSVIGSGSHGFKAGGVFESTPKILIGNEFSGNGGYGIEWDGVNGQVVGNDIADNTSGGILAQANESLSIIGNTIASNTGYGADLRGGAGNRGAVFSGNTVKYNGQHGIVVNGAHWSVKVNQVDSNGRTTNNTYDGIHLGNDADDCRILVNTITQDGNANKHRYGINVVGAAAVNNWVAGNDSIGAVTAEYNDAGTGTINVWAGAFGDNY